MATPSKEERQAAIANNLANVNTTGFKRRVSVAELGNDGFAGLQELGGNATLLFYNSEEGNEGRQAYLEKRKPDFSKFKRLP